MGEEYIAHHGTTGQKWYQRNYQYPDGTYTELGKARRRVGDGERRPMLTEEEKRQRRIAYYDKKEAINHGDILYASKHLNEFSNRELDDLIDRYSKNKRISDMVAAIENEDKFTMEKLAKKLETASSIADSSASIFRSINTVHKSMYEISNRGKDKGGDKRKDDNYNNYKKKNKSNKKSHGGLFSGIKFISKQNSKGKDIYTSYNESLDKKKKSS